MRNRFRAAKLAKKAYMRRKKYFDNWRYYAKVIKDLAIKELGEVKVIVFGSVVKGDYHPALSDIDVLIVSPNMPESNLERAKIKVRILDRIGKWNPFEIHLVNPKEYEWYRKFILLDKYVEV